MNIPPHSKTKTTPNKTFQQPINQHTQSHQQHLNQTHQRNPQRASANSTIFNRQEINTIYDSFLKKIEDTKISISQAFQIPDKEPQATELRKHIFQKPSLQEAINLNLFIDNTPFTLHKEEIQDDIEQSQICLKKVQNMFRDCQGHLSDWKSSVDPNQMIEISRSIDLAWSHIYKLTFYDPCLIQEICEIEWFLRAKEVLSHERSDSQYPYVKYCEDLQKGAEESQSDKIKESDLFKRVEGELMRYQRFMEKLKGIQENTKKEEIQGLLEDLKEFGFGLKEEREFLEKILQKVTPQIQKKSIVPNIDKSSLVQVKLEDFMDSVLHDISKTRDSSQKSQEEKLRSEVAQKIFLASKELLGRLAMDMTGSLPNGGEISEKQNISAFSEQLIKNLQEHPPKFEDICDWSQIIQEFNLYTKEFEQIKAELCLSKVKFIKVFSETLSKPTKPILFQDLNKLLIEVKGYYLHSLHEDFKKEIFEEQLNFLKDFMKKVRAQIQTEVDLQRENQWRPPNIMIYNFIDISSEFGNLKKKLQDKQRVDQVSMRIVQNNQVENLNKKRSSTSHPEEQEEINSFDLVVKKIKGEKNYKKVNRSGESSDTVPQEGLENNVNLLVEEIIGDAKRKEKNDKKRAERNNGREEDEFVIKKKGTKKYLNGGALPNVEQSESPIEIQKGEMLVEEIIFDAGRRVKNDKRNSQDEEKSMTKKKGTKKYLNEDYLPNFEQNYENPVRQYNLDQINDFLLEIDDGFKLKKKNKNV